VEVLRVAGDEEGGLGGDNTFEQPVVWVVRNDPRQPRCRRRSGSPTSRVAALARTIQEVLEIRLGLQAEPIGRLRSQVRRRCQRREARYWRSASRMRSVRVRASSRAARWASSSKSSRSDTVIGFVVRMAEPFPDVTV
jgi:ribosomal protein S12 methylthiotransferase accessory factor YcaO